MTLDSTLQRALRNLPLFAGMSESQREQIIEMASTETKGPGETVLRQGETGQSLWVVLEGKCQVIKLTASDPPLRVTLAELLPFGHFGEMSFFHETPHSADVETVTSVRLLRIARKDFDALIQSDTIAAYKLALNCVDELADRLRRMDEWVTELLAYQPAERQASEWNRFREKLFSNE